jgi:hypothetical protein
VLTNCGGKNAKYQAILKRMGGWAIAQSPMMKTTVTISRLEQKGYVSFTRQLSKSRRVMPEVQLKLPFV